MKAKLKHWDADAFRQALAAFPPTGMSVGRLQAILRPRLKGCTPNLTSFYMQYRTSGAPGPAGHVMPPHAENRDLIAQEIEKALNLKPHTLWSE